MLLSPKNNQKLIDFSLFQDKQPSTQAPIDQQTRLQIVQKEWLEGDGLDVIPNLTSNMQKSIDASSGSSAFAPPEKIEDELIEPKSSQLPEYHNHLPQEDLVKAAEKYFHQIGVLGNATQLKQDIYGASLSTDYYCVIGHGTTHLFTSSLKSVIKTKGDVIIVTQPSYGLFLGPILKTQGDIEPLVLNEKNHFKPSANELKQLIATTNSDKKAKYFKEIQIMSVMLNAYLSEKKIAQPQRKSLLQLINNISNEAKNKDKQDFAHLDIARENFNLTLHELLQKGMDDDEANRWYEKLNIPLCQRVRGYFHMNPHMPMGTICDQGEINKLAQAIKPFTDVQVIDDLTYYDLVLPDTKRKPGTFAKSDLSLRTLTLYSLSKQFALASVRAGMALGPQHLIKPICEDILDTNNTPNIFTRDAFDSIFHWNQKQREEYLSETNQEYVNRRDLTLALLQGLPANTPPAKFKSIQQMLTKLGVSVNEQKQLFAGIPGLKSLIIPESGFFITIDFSHYQGKYLGTTKLMQSRDFRNAFYRLADVNTIPGEMMYMFDKPVLRFSYSMTPKEIMDAILRMKAVLALCQNRPLSAKEIAAVKKANESTRPVPKNSKKPMVEKEIMRLYLPKYEASLKQKTQNINNTSASVSPTIHQRKKGKRTIKVPSVIDY